MTAPLMPKATAIWLVENTALTFRQISKFCEIHELEIQAIADGDISYNMIGLSPINNGQLTWQEIRRCEADESADLVPNVLEKNVKERNAKAKKLLSPTQRNDKPSAILWILKNCPEIMDSQVCKLVGTTKATINKVRNGEYGDDLFPKNPVAVGLCNERDLEAALAISQAQKELKEKKSEPKKKKAPAKKKNTKKAVKTTTAKKAVKKAVAKKPAKSTAKKTAAKKVSEKKTAAKKAPAKKTATKKTTAKKATVKKAATKTTAKKSATAKKATTKKTTTKKTVAKKAK